MFLLSIMNKLLTCFLISFLPCTNLIVKLEYKRGLSSSIFAAGLMLLLVKDVVVKL